MMSGVEPLKRAFVTGATGGIGSSLCERLSTEGWRVVALARPESQTSHIENLDGLTLVTCDLLNEARLGELMQGCDAVFHLAAMVHVQAHVAESALRRINVDGTRAVVSAARAARVPAFVFFSTVAVYPEREEMLDESSPVAPATSYGVTKLAAETLVLQARDVMRVTVLRLPVVYGPRDRGNMRRLIEAIANRRFFVPGSGENVKTMVAVDNVVEAALLVASHPRAAGQVYLVTDARPSTLFEIVSAVSIGLGMRRTPRKVPLAALMAAGWFADALRGVLGVTLPVSGDQVRKLASNTRYSGERIRRDLGFKPRVGLEEGIASAIAGFRLHPQDHVAEAAGSRWLGSIKYRLSNVAGYRTPQ
jgi:nucleoside-diphosphate-sugar epimerase